VIPGWISYLLIPGLACVSVAGLTYLVIQALRSGAEDYSRHYAATTARHLDDMFLFIPPRRILELAAAAALAGFLIVFLLIGGFQTRGAFLRGVILGAVAAGAGWSLPHRILALLKQRRIRRFNDQLSDALLTLSNALKAGFSILQAFEAVVRTGVNPIAEEFGVFLQETRVGVKFEEALANLRKRVDSEDLTLLILAIETARLTGGNLTEVLDNIALTIRERTRVERRVQTLTAMGRLQGNVVGAVPILLALLLTAIDPVMMSAFFHSPAGWVTAALVVILEIAGFLLIRKIVRIDI
jgi:tight adherence protein B